MANPSDAPSSSSSSSTLLRCIPEDEEGDDFLYSESGWVEARHSCDHLASLSTNLSHIPPPGSACNICQDHKENWLCLVCENVFCSRFVNKHMLHHFDQTNHCVALSYSDMSVWCFYCDAYLDGQVITQLRPIYETCYTLKFGEAPPPRTLHHIQSQEPFPGT